MKIRNQNLTWGGAVALALLTQASSGANYIMLNDPGLSTGFEQRWNDPNIWSLDSGVDDGANGIPDGADTFEINRNTGGFPQGSTDLSNEGMPNGHSIAGITGTGAPGRDLVLKTADTTIGNLTILASPASFEIFEERDSTLTIDGVISGTGTLRLTRNGGFTPDGVSPDELITIGGTVANTFSGTMELFNNSASEPGFWLADKVGAFGQSSLVSLAAPNGAVAGAASLRISSNAIGGGGAFDDILTLLQLGENGVLDLDAGVNEVISQLELDLAGTGTFTAVGPGTYDNTAPWITGPGLVTVIPEPSSLAFAALSFLCLARRKR